MILRAGRTLWDLFLYSTARQCGFQRTCLEPKSTKSRRVFEPLEDRTLLTVAWEPLDPLGGLIFEGGTSETIGQVEVFSDDFESGALGPEWSTNSSTVNGRTAVTSALGTPAQSGSSHLAMDTQVAGFNNLNEAVLTLDLSGVSEAELSFWHKDVNDEDNALPGTFLGSFNGDGVAISEDGVTWHTLVSLNNANSPNQTYTNFQFDLDQAAAAAGISLGANFQIKFQQFDNFPFNSDGRTFDDVLVTGSALTVNETSFFLEQDQALTVVATPEDSGATLSVTVFDPANAVVGTATAAAPGEPVDLQTLEIAADGTYRVEVTSSDATQFDLRLLRNATVEVVDTADGAEQDATGSYISLGSGRFGIVGRFDAVSGPDSSSETSSAPIVLNDPVAAPEVYGDPGEPGRFPPGPSATAQTAAPNELLVNGSFENGNFAGWTLNTTGAPFRPWAVTGSGQGGGFGMLQTQPQDGAFVAWNGFDGSGPMEFQLYQDVTIAAGATATLSWMDRVQWNFTLGGTATLPRLYDVEIRDPVSNAILDTVFSFSTDTQAQNPTGNTGWQNHSVDVSAFAGQTVRLFFRQQIPQSSTGPGQFELDAVSLTEGTVDQGEVLYAGVGRGSPINPGGILLIDQNSGAGALVADTINPGGLTGLAFDGSNRLWGTSINGPLGNRVSDLVQFDPNTGAVLSSVPITFNGTPISIGDLAVQPGTDAVYAVHSNSDATSVPGGVIFTIDTTTGAATMVGDPLQNRNGGLAFAPDGTLYFAEFNELHTLDPANAAVLTTITLSFGSHDGLGIRPSDGTLFASQAGAGAANDGIRIIDPVTGNSTLLGTTGAGNVSDLAFRVLTAQPDVDEYLLDLTGHAGRSIDVVLSSDVVSATEEFRDALTQSNNLFAPNVLHYDFTGVPTPVGDATLRLDAVGDLNGTNEFLTVAAEGIFSQQVFVTGGLQQQPVSTTITISQSILDQLAADGTISFTVTPSTGVNNLGPNSLTLDVSYPTPQSGAVTLELLDTDGTTVLATAAASGENFALGILDFIVPADGVYTLRVSSDTAGKYSIVATESLVFDTESNDPGDAPLRSLDQVDGGLGYLRSASTDLDLSLLQSFESLSSPADSGFIPPDPIVAVGPESVVTMVNTDVAIHDKTTGAVIVKNDLDGPGFWNTTNVVFDPWIAFDHGSGRFYAIGIDRVSGGVGSSRLYLAVSTDATPTNLTTDWHKYVIDRTGTHTVTGGSTFPDYPKLGFDDHAIYVTGNDFGINGGGFSHASLVAFEKAPLLAGGPANVLYDEAITGAFSVHPVATYDAGAPMYFAQAVGTTGIRIHRIDNILTSPTRSTTTVGVPTFLFPPDVPQQGGPPLDSVSQRIMSGVVRDGSLWTAHAVVDPAVDGETVVRWYEFDVTGSPSLVQSGNVDPGPGVHTWMTHINVDNDGDMGIAFSVSGPNMFASIGYTGRLATDAPGTTRPVEIARNGEGSYSRFDGIGRNRWGDYSGLALDPDGETFWLYNEYAAAGNNWGTFVGSFQVEPASPEPVLDTYQISLVAGERIGVSTSTPFDSPIDGLNLLDPALEILDPGGVPVAFDSNSAADGKNASIPMFTAGATGVYKIIVSAESEGGGEYVLAVNRAPDVRNLVLSANEIDENDAVTLTGEYADSPGDSHTVVVDWGDPNSSSLTFELPSIQSLTAGQVFAATNDSSQSLTVLEVLPAGVVRFAVAHQYLDDGPAPGNATSADVSTVNVTVTDDGGLSDTESTDVLVLNVAPVVESLVSSAETPQIKSEDGNVSISGLFSDVGTLDLHTVTVDWGDGTPAETLTSVNQVDDSFDGDHEYSEGGVFTITVTVADDDGGVTSTQTTAVVTGVGLHDGQLQIIGTGDNDHVQVLKTGKGVKVLAKLGGAKLQSYAFNESDIDSILILGCEGDDHLAVNQQLDIPATIYGDGGNDHLRGGSGNDLLLGGDGNDQIHGGDGNDVVYAGAGDDHVVAGAGNDIVVAGAGNDNVEGGQGLDILIGGTGRDHLNGGRDDDVLVGGSTVFDDDAGALGLLLAEWTSGRSYSDRVENLRNGTGPELGGTGIRLSADDTVLDDGETDKLTGASGLDYFFAAEDDNANSRRRRGAGAEELDEIGVDAVMSGQ